MGNITKEQRGKIMDSIQNKKAISKISLPMAFIFSLKFHFDFYAIALIAHSVEGSHYVGIFCLSIYVW